MKTKIITTAFLVGSLLTSALAQDNEVPQQVVEQTIYDPNGYGHLKFVKTIEIPFCNNVHAKVSALAPLGKGKGFRANDSNKTPPDGAVAVSDSGLILIADNTGIEYRNTKGDTVSIKDCWKELLYNNPCINDDSIFFSDPRLVYDTKNNRFILVIVQFHNVVDGIFGSLI
jgi:hypothetical protein